MLRKCTHILPLQTSFYEAGADPGICKGRDGGLLFYKFRPRLWRREFYVKKKNQNLPKIWGDGGGGACACHNDQHLTHVKEW